MTKYLTSEEIIAINIFVIQTFSPDEQSGVKFPYLLDSAVNRSKQSAFGGDAYPTIYDKAVALLESLAQNHPFHSANKRTAFLSLLQFLSYNGHAFVMDPQQAADVVVNVVNHQYTLEQLAQIIALHTT